MSVFGQVSVKNNKYKPQGSFHQVIKNSPIRDADHNWRLLGVTKPRAMTYMHSYGGEAVFFESLPKGKLLATRCDNTNCDSTGIVYLPFRIHCPDCLSQNSIIDITSIAKTTATIHTFMVCERSGAFSMLEKPIKFINIEIDGVATILMSYLLLGEPVFGKRVVPIFKTTDPSYTILDLSWVVEGTTVKDLPEGFCF
ncbi:Zn-ribbon domain-containing OB-fold protein [Desulforhopalus sp. 52FAK]